jgi:hypothetical protein
MSAVYWQRRLQHAHTNTHTHARRKSWTPKMLGLGDISRSFHKHLGWHCSPSYWSTHATSSGEWQYVLVIFTANFNRFVAEHYTSRQSTRTAWRRATALSQRHKECSKHSVPSSVPSTMYRQCWTIRRGPVSWPQRSPNLTPTDLHLQGHVKSVVYATDVHSTENLWQRKKTVNSSETRLVFTNT